LSRAWPFQERRGGGKAGAAAGQTAARRRRSCWHQEADLPRGHRQRQRQGRPAGSRKQKEPRTPQTRRRCRPSAVVALTGKELRRNVRRLSRGSSQMKSFALQAHSWEGSRRMRWPHHLPKHPHDRRDRQPAVAAHLAVPQTAPAQRMSLPQASPLVLEPSRTPPAQKEWMPSPPPAAPRLAAVASGKSAGPRAAPAVPGVHRRREGPSL